MEQNGGSRKGGRGTAKRVRPSASVVKRDEANEAECGKDRHHRKRSPIKSKPILSLALKTTPPSKRRRAGEQWPPGFAVSPTEGSGTLAKAQPSRTAAQGDWRSWPTNTNKQRWSPELPKAESCCAKLVPRDQKDLFGNWFGRSRLHRVNSSLGVTPDQPKAMSSVDNSYAAQTRPSCGRTFQHAEGVGRPVRSICNSLMAFFPRCRKKIGFGRSARVVLEPQTIPSTITQTLAGCPKEGRKNGVPAVEATNFHPVLIGDTFICKLHEEAMNREKRADVSAAITGTLMNRRVDRLRGGGLPFSRLRKFNPIRQKTVNENHPQERANGLPAVNQLRGKSFPVIRILSR